MLKIARDLSTRDRKENTIVLIMARKQKNTAETGIFPRCQMRQSSGNSLSFPIQRHELPADLQSTATFRIGCGIVLPAEPFHSDQPDTFP